MASMRWNGGRPLDWSTFERVLSGKHVTELRIAGEEDKPSVRFYSRQRFAELHARSSYNFLRGAANPEQMLAAAAASGLEAIALLDRDGLYGAVETAMAAERYPVGTVFGAELSLHDSPPLVVLCKNPGGYQVLSHVITNAKMLTGVKDHTTYPPLGELGQAAAGRWYILAGPEWWGHIDALIRAFGRDNVLVECVLSQTPQDAQVFAEARALMARCHLRGVLSTRPAAATQADIHLAMAKLALEQRENVEQAYRRAEPMGAWWIRSGDTLARVLGGRDTDLMDAAADIAAECAFPLRLVTPQLPRCTVPEGHTEMTWLRHLIWQRFDKRYATEALVTVREAARAQVERECAVIEQLGFPGYFLIVTDLVDFAKSQGILCQGRGSAANSVVCFALGITHTEPIRAGLLFERFLSPEREGPPDIDIDIESGRREEVIQYAYTTYGRDNAAQVANVITYRHKGAIRDAGRALGYPQGAIDNWSRGLTDPPEVVMDLAEKFRGHPRHLGIHSGGMVLCDRPIADVVPVEWARMPGRSVVQWDKEGCAWANLVKFDLLGLGMLEALHHMIDLVAATCGRTINLWELDITEEAVYDMLSRGDAVGVFQVESRAQLAMLPRLKPRCFFDLVVEIALVRPGPIQGGSVHPYIRRRNGEEPVTYDHPVLEKSLAKTLGIPLFQEQLMHIAVDAAGFSGGQADELRRAMGAKRSPARMAALKEQFYRGLADTNAITGEVADRLWNKIVAFAAYGFPESHSQSFASLVFFSAWFKLHYPAEFCIGLLRAQPMGFYSPQSLLADARRHGVTVLPISINHSAVDATPETLDDGQVAIRLGLGMVSGLRAPERIVAAAPFTSVADVARRAGVNVTEIEALATAGALAALGVGRREALWQAGVAATEREGMLPGFSSPQAPPLPGMSALELLVADVASTGVTHDRHPMVVFREYLSHRDIVPAERLLACEDGRRIQVAGIVTHRQRPQTASGIIFLGMEDETGLMNIVLSPGVWARYRKVARTSRALIVRGIVENANGVASIKADRLSALPAAQLLATSSRDFR